MREMIAEPAAVISGFKPMRVPDAPARSFRDLWPGDAARGARLMRGEFEALGTSTSPAHEPGGAGWDESRAARSRGAPPRTASPGCATSARWAPTARRTRARDLAEDWLSRGGNRETWPRRRKWRPRASPPGSAIGTSWPPPPMTGSASGCWPAWRPMPVRWSAACRRKRRTAARWSR